MARSDAVWGIDIGNCSLKALRCRPGADPQMLEAIAFDFIEYPKILTQPDAQPEQLVAEALAQFLSRNETRGDRIALSVSGQNGLARFIKLPPVEAKKIPDMVKYEARQQIPFDLQDVVWDYQRLGVGAEEEGVVMDTEIGLFAMKRDVAYRAIAPLQKAGLEVDFLQLTPLSLFNFVAFDQLRDAPPVEEYDPDHPPASAVVLSMGTDATDFVVTNGYKVWQRSIPIGGNHFTKALTKELKLTFAKAEHLKRNVASAPDAKTVFQAMRPVFNQLLTEIQRSIGFFTNLDRKAEISRMIVLGNAMKLPGLRKYLAQSLGLEVVRGDEFQGLAGPEVLSAPAFRENRVCFGVAYGLVLQGMGRGKLVTNLMPVEILKDRMVRAKKPWALATAASVLLGLTISYAGATQALSSVSESRFKSAEGTASSVQSFSSGLKSKKDAQLQQFVKINDVGRHLTSNIEGRIEWLELLQAIQTALPVDRPTPERAQMTLEERIADKNTLFITDISNMKVTPEEVATWFEVIKTKDWYKLDQAEIAALEQQAAAEGLAPELDPAAEGSGPQLPPPVVEGEAYIIQLRGYHCHNSSVAELNRAGEFVRNTLIRNLKHGKVALPPSLAKQEQLGPNAIDMVKMDELGISYPVLIDERKVQIWPVLDPAYQQELMARKIEAGRTGGSTESPYGSYEDESYDDYESEGYYGPDSSGTGPGGIDREEYMLELRRFDFVVQFLWQPTPPSEREALRAAAAEAAALEADNATDDASTLDDDTSGADTTTPVDSSPTGPAGALPPEPAPASPLPVTTQPSPPSTP